MKLPLKLLSLFMIAIALLLVSPTMPVANAATVLVSTDIQWYGQSVCGYDDFSNFCGRTSVNVDDTQPYNCDVDAWGWISSWAHDFLAYCLNVLGLQVYFSCS